MSSGADCQPRPVRVFIDYSNFWIGAKAAVARKNNFVTNEDHRVRCNIRILTNKIGERFGRRVTEVNVYGSEPPRSEDADRESGWTWWQADDYDFRLHFCKRDPQTGKELGVDEAMRQAIADTANADIAVVSGDGGFISAIRNAVRYGCRVIVYSWKHTINGNFRDMTVVPLDDCQDQITFVKRKFTQNPEKIICDEVVRLVLRVKRNSQICGQCHEPSVAWCIKLEELTKFPYQYYWCSASSDDLVLVFSKQLLNVAENQKIMFNATDFLKAEHKIEDVVSQDHYPERCPYKFCCKYGKNCYLRHTEEEKEFLSTKSPLPRKKIEYCLLFKENICSHMKKAENCDYAHGQVDAMCPNCREKGHFEYYCPKQK